MRDVIQNMYLSGSITNSQRLDAQKSCDYAADVARADFIVVNDQSNFAYQYFKGRNYQNGDVSPFNRDLQLNTSNPMTGLDVMVGGALSPKCEHRILLVLSAFPVI